MRTMPCSSAEMWGSGEGLVGGPVRGEQRAKSAEGRHWFALRERWENSYNHAAQVLCFFLCDFHVVGRAGMIDIGGSHERSIALFTPRNEKNDATGFFEKSHRAIARIQS